MTTEHVSLDLFFIKVGGTDIPVSAMEDLIEVVVEDDLAQPAMFVLRFVDSEFTLIDGALFELGSEVQILASDINGKAQPLIKGEVTALEPELTQDRVELIVRGYDWSHRLYCGRNTRTFLKQSDTAIFKSVVRDAGLKPEVSIGDVKEEQFDYVAQDGLSDMEFLRARAARTGYRMIIDDKTVTLTTDKQFTKSAPPQDFGTTLLSFRSRLSAAIQANQVEVRSWDPTAKKTVVGNATNPSQPAAIDNDGTGVAANEAFSRPAKIIVSDQPVMSGKEAKNLAQAVLDDLAGDYLTIEATCLGEPAIRAGTTVELRNIGKRFSGHYSVTAARHEYTGAGYYTTFYVNGRRPNSVLDPATGASERHVIHGVAVGVVTNVNDPENLGRVKLKYPWFDEKQESDWVRLASPGAGPQRGLMLLPEIHDEMLVAFEHGDINRPYVLGGLWNPKDKPPATALESGKVMIRTIRTRAGHLIEFREDGTDGKGAILVKTAKGRLMEFSDNDQLIRIKSANHTITMDDKGKGSVTVESGGTLFLKGSGSMLSFTKDKMELSGPSGPDDFNGSAKLTFTPRDAELTAQGNRLMMNATGIVMTATKKLDAMAETVINIQSGVVKIN